MNKVLGNEFRITLEEPRTNERTTQKEGREKVEGFFDQIILYSGISLPSLVELLDFLSLLAQITQMSCCVDWVLWRRIFQENNNKKKEARHWELFQGAPQQWELLI